MPTFALIAEGPTDQVVLERIIVQTCSAAFPDDEIAVNYLQPLRDETDSFATNFGGWELVLEYCRLRFNDALETNDFVVIHLDTDMGDHPNCNVPLTENGVDRDHGDILRDARELIVLNIGEAAFDAVRDRVIFAISVHSIESWLLLCLFNRDEPKGSFNRLNTHLIRRNEAPLVKEIRRYQALVKPIKAKRLNAIRLLDGSLTRFLRDLEATSARQI